MTNAEVALEAPERRALWRNIFGIVVAAVAPFFVVPSLLTKAASSDFLPHRYCYLNTPGLVWTNVATDVVIGLSYIAISATLAYLVHRARKAIPFSWMFLAFGLFIVACGGTHIMEVVTVWKPFYWLSADVKIVTALASLITAITLPALVPQTFSLLSANQIAAERKRQLEAANARLTELEQMSVQIAGEAATGLAFWEWHLSSSVMRWRGDVAQVLGVGSIESLDHASGFLGLVHAEDRQSVDQISQLTLQNPRCDVEFRVLHSDGGVRWLMGKTRLTSDADTAMGVFIDVTTKKQAEIALQRSEKLAVTGRLATTVAHEINNPLQAVSNLLFVASQDPTLSESVHSSLQSADSEVKRIAGIVRSLLGFHRDSSSPQKTDVKELIENALAMYEPELRKKRVEVERRYDGAFFATLKPNDMRQVFANLVSNSLDALPSGGRLRIGMKTQGTRLKISVTDTGMGIAPEARSKLFEAFFTTKGEKGTGLGLWISHEIVERSGGKLRFRSIRNKAMSGTTFQLTIPLDGATQA